MTSTARYGPVAQAFHWTTAALVLVAFIYGPGGSEEHVYSDGVDTDRRIHETLGLCVFALVALRLPWRLYDTHPDRPSVSRWMGIASKALQWTLYALLFAVPMTAIGGAWLGGHPVTLLSDVTIEPWLGRSHDAGAKMATVHKWLGDILLWLAGLHALAALYHRFVLKDGLLASMLPAWPGTGRD